MPAKPEAEAGFQFTLPCRERLVIGHATPYSDGFNSRSRVGSDSTPASPPPSATGFNSRSRVGSDTVLDSYEPRMDGFNSRSRVGSDSRMRVSTFCASCFNSRSRVGSDPSAPQNRRIHKMFQFTLPCRERPQPMMPMLEP